MFKNAVIRFVAQVLFTLYTGVVVCMLAMAAHSVIITYAYMQWEPVIAVMIPAVGILDGGNHQCFHDSFDQGGFSGSNRPHHTNIDIAAGAPGNILINAVHSLFPLRQWQE